MKLSVSNIAWDTSEDDAVGAVLRDRGVSAVEIAPTKYWPAPCDPGRHEIQRVRRAWQQRGQQIVAMQSLLYGRNDLSIFGDRSNRRATAAYLVRIIQIAELLGAKVLVFGSPRNRDRGEYSFHEALDEAAAFFRPLAARAADAGCAIGWEPNPEAYHCNFCTTVEEALLLVRRVDHPGFGLHLDTGIMHINRENPREAVRAGRSYLVHVHVSEPQLAVIGDGGVPHGRFAAALEDHAWDQYVSIEMRSGSNGAGNVSRVRRAVETAQGAYHE